MTTQHYPHAVFRLDPAQLQALVCAEGQKLSRADADFVQASA